MARLDPIIDRLLNEQGLEVFFQSGGQPILRTLTQTGKLMKNPLATAQIVTAFSEIVPEHLRDRFPVEGVTRWHYTTAAGLVRVTFNKRDERVSASIKPMEGEDDSELTQKLPQDVMGPAEPSPATRLAAVLPSGPAMPIPVRRAATPPREERPTEPALTLVEADPGLHLMKPPPPPIVVDDSDPLAVMTLLLNRMLDQGASDLHLTSDTVPMFRIDGEMRPDPKWHALGPERLQALLFSITPERNQEEWKARKDSDFAYETERSRFRVNLFADRKGIGAVLRQIPNDIKTAEELGLSPAITQLCSLSKGLVLVTGPTGSGKSTTLAAMIDHINRTREDHIITIEDPVEFVHPNRRCLVNQREVGVHTSSFKQALRAALREDPDIILVGELRDLETIAIAIETAETGHLVFGTLHTNTAPSTVDRIIDQFPPDRQSQVRTMLAESLKGVIAQTLCKRIGGGRAAAHEVLLINPAVSNLIREGKTFQLPSAMQVGKAQGMTTLNDSLLDLVKRNVVEPKVALQKAVARNELKSMFERAGIKLEEDVPAAAPANKPAMVG